MKGMFNKIAKSIQVKLQIFILSSVVIVFLLTIIYVSLENRDMALDEAKRLIIEVAQKRASDIQSELNKDFMLTNTLGKAFQDLVLCDPSTRETVLPPMLKRVFEHNPHLQSIWMHWELSAIDKNYYKDYGRVRKTFFRIGNNIKFKIDTVDLKGNKKGGLYYQIKNNKKNIITEPYWYSYTGEKSDEMFETSICAPVLQSTRFLGLMGIDLKLDRFEKLIKQIKPYEGSYAFFTSNTGTFIYHPDPANIGVNLITSNKDDNNKYKIERHLKFGKQFSFIRNKDNQKLFVTFAPVFIGDTNTPWFLSIVVPHEEMLSKVNQNMKKSLLIGLVGILVLAIVLYLIAKNITQPLVQISNLLKELSQGKIDSENTVQVKSKDEIGSIFLAVNELKNNLSRTAKFAEEIGKGNLSVDFQKLSPDDVLGKALLEMRSSLQKTEEEETKRKKENQVQHWITDGVSRTNELMRKYNDLTELSYQAVKFVANYLNANQGALYILSDKDVEKEEEITFEAISALAWGRKKSLRRKVKMGETLVGRSAYEQTILHITDVPESYVNITSGLGKATPRALLIVPLILNEEVMAVLEIISFNEFDQHQIEFVKKAGESIASTIASLKISEHTSKLLDQTKSQAGELTEKEEELRQQMEEMQATQEEASKRQAEMSGVITAINSIAFVAEFDMEGSIISVNEAYAQLLEMSKQQILGKKQGFLQAGEDQERVKSIEQLWAKMRKGIPHKQDQKIEINEKTHWLSEVYTPIMDSNGDPQRVINIAMDITHLKG